MAKKQAKPKKSILDVDIAIGRITLAQKALFAKHLSVMLKSGLPIADALSIAYDSAEGRFKRVLRGVLKSVKAGHSLSDSFAQYPKVFSGLFISATYAGESSGTLEENLINIAEQLEKETELIGKIKGAMMYPIVVLTAAFFLGLALAFLVLPKITPLFEGLKVELPFTTRALIWFSNFIQDYGTWFFSGIIIFVLFMLWLIKRKFSKPVVHLILLKIVIIKKISRNTNLARFCRTLGTLLKSGLNIDEALEITHKTLGNYYYSRAIEEVAKRIGKGNKLSTNLMNFSSLFPVMIIRMVRVGEESGKLEESLLYLANFYEVEVDNSTKSLSASVEPILLIVIGLVVGFLALSIITPIYQITGNVQR